MRRIIIAIASLAALAAACTSSPTTTPSAPTSAPATSQPTGASPTPTEAPTPATGTKVIAEGQFERIGYEGEGTASIVDIGSGLEVRFTRFSVEEGPALRVYLSDAPAGSPESRYDDDFVDLGELASFSGDQTYPVPADVDPSDYRSIVIWCAEFSVGFVVAPIARAGSPA